MNDKIKGYIYGIVASATYGMIPLFTLPLYSAGMDIYSVLFIRYTLAIGILALMIKARGRSFHISGANLKSILIFGSVFAVSSISLFTSYKYMDAGIASTLLFVYPIIVALIMRIFFRERLSLYTILCMAGALGGIVLLYKGDGAGTLSVLGTVMAILSALSYAIYIVGINRSTLKEVPTVTLTFYMLTAGWIVFGICVLIRGELNTPDVGEWLEWGCMFALALLPTAISLICTTKAVQYIGSTPTAILGAMEPVTAIIFGLTVFGETISGREWAGIALIIVAVSIVVAGGNFSAILIRIKKLFPKLHNKR